MSNKSSVSTSMSAIQYPINLLVVDDSDEDRAVYRRYLGKQTQFSCKITEAETGEEGLEELKNSLPDLILLDYLLPDFSGLEFVAELQSQGMPIPPIIMLTGQGNEAVAVEAMKSGVKDYLVKGNLTPNSLISSIANVIQQYRLKQLLVKNQQQQQLIAETALRIRQSLDVLEIINTAVKEVQLLLDCDRVIIYRFAPDMSGDIVAESVKSVWKQSLGMKVIDSCFQEGGTTKYRQGETLAIDNVYEAGLTECHLNLLEEFQVKANAIVPVLLVPSASEPVSSRLWGLLIAHQCSHSRHWETDEVELLDKLAVQLAIAIQQAELIESLQTELTARKKLEEELERLVSVLEASEDYIGLADVEGRVIWNNPQMKQIIGVKDEADIDNLTITDYHPSWACDLVQNEGISTALTQGTWLGETALSTKDGREIPVSQLIIAHKSPQGDVEYISTVMRDLTKQIETENSLRERAEELNWANQELLKATRLLKKRNQELDRFAYVTSHDLKAPLRAIANLASWLSEDLEGQLSEENQHHLALMQSRVKRMDGLIQGLLRYSRVGRKSNSLEVIQVKDLLARVIDSLSPPPEFKIAIASPMPTLKTDVISLEQVFSNLISNAIKYHHQSTGTIAISVRDLGKMYEFAIADDGPGIEPEHHERIFKIFQTLQARDTFESTGIGLSIVKKILEERGNSIRVESQLGKGATFYFTWNKSNKLHSLIREDFEL
ncbi:response regulator [Pleurocapsales cyanobacterium LEGE 10410]|nr:response regulator [Pleurocapsales cyanobacterium LEGE 10410]